MEKRWVLVLVAILLLGTGLGGCGGTSSPVPTEPPTVPPATAAPAATAEPVPTAPSDPLAGQEDRSIFRQGLIDEAQGILDGLPGASLYRLDLQIPEDFTVLQGHEEVLYTNQEEVALKEIYFQLFPNTAGGRATVSALQVDGQAVEPTLKYQDSVIQVPLAEALSPGEQILVQMDFAVEIPREMGGNYGLLGYFEGALVLDEFYPVIPVYDDEGWNVKDPSPNGDITYLDTSFYLVQVTAPADMALVSSGVEVARQEDGGSQVVSFAAGPARDFYLAGSLDWIEVKQTVGETTVRSYALPQWEDAAREAMRVAADALEVFSQRYGPYPYTEYDLISSPMLALGIEYPGMTSIGIIMYDLESELYGLPAQVMLESTVVHEVAHQWFYNVVGSDQVDDPWLDEAVVQYVTSLYYRDLYGTAAEYNNRGGWDFRWNRVDRAEIPIGMPTSAYAPEEYSPIVYGRGPYFMDALEKHMGRDTFDAFMRDYYQTHLWGIATPESFRQLAEQHCGCDLGELFEAWVYGEALPAGGENSSADGEVRGWAVLAEKDDYDDVQMTNLPVGYIGLIQVRQVLEAAGWDPEQIMELREFDRVSLEEGLDWLAQNADQDDVVFMYVASHGMYLKRVLLWEEFFAAEWAEVPSHRRVLLIDSCQAANYTGVVDGDPNPHLSIAAVDGDEYGWSGLEEEGLPIIGGVFTHYFAAAFGDPAADTDGNGRVSVQEAALLAEEQQRTYMHEVVFAVPEFVESFHDIGSYPDEDPSYPDVILHDTIGEPLYLDLEYVGESSSGTTPPAGDVASWVKTYGGDREDVGQAVLLAEDGGYFIVGATNLEFDAAIQGDLYLIRTNASGEVLWEKTYEEERYRHGQSISWADDGSLLVSGVTASPGSGGMDIFLTKLDREGNELWSRTFGGPLDEFGAAWPMEDGGYFLGGNLVDPDDIVADPGAAGYGGFAGRSNVYVARTDNDGNELWSRTFGGESNVVATAAAPSADGGGLILATIMYYPENGDDIYLLKVDEDGNEVWSHTWEQDQCTGRGLIATADGNYLLTGIYAPIGDADSSAQDFLFIKVDPDGNEIWRSSFGDPDKIDYASVLAEAPDGGYVAAGNRVTSLSSWDEDLVLVKIDENGQLLWERVIETNSHNMFGAMQRHPDGGYVVVASTYQGGNFDVLVVKTDTEGMCPRRP